MINRVSDLLPASVQMTGGNQQASAGDSFAKVLGNALDKTANLEIQSAVMGEQLAAGQGADLHSVMIASEKASLAVQLTVQVRNKAVEAYQEIMRMQM
jgi:flagellar hook-basal body complex protein FliE